MIRYWLTFGITLLIISCADYKIQNKENIVINNSTPTDSVMITSITPYKTSLDSIMNETIGHIAVDMNRLKTEPETKLGNFVADLTFSYVLNKTTQELKEWKPDMCIMNFGGLRTSLSKGPVTRGKVFELMPFENMVVVVKLDKNSMQELFDYLARVGGQPVSNAALIIKNGEPYNITVNNAPLENRFYYVVTTDYLANGGDNMSFFEGKPRYTFDKLRDVIIQHFESSNEPLKAKIEGRITYAE